MSEHSDDRLQQIQGELSSILETRLSALSQILQQTEATTRRIIAADIEMERHRLRTAQLDAERTLIEGELQAARERAEVIHKKHAAILAERERVVSEVEKRQSEVRELDSEVERHRQRITALEAEANTLRNDNTDLRTKVKTLEENIVRMQRLKDELMSSVTGLAQQLRQASGSE